MVRLEGEVAVALSVCDETASGEKTPACSLDFLTETITVRELIRERVYQEVREYNAKDPGYFKGLVEPADAERVLNGYKLRTARKIDWEKQYSLAVRAFESNGFFVLVDDRQVRSLDESILITPNTQVSFIRLLPLVGG